MAFCAKCGAQVNEGAAFCQACGAPAAAVTATGQATGAAPAPAAASSGMTSNVAGMLSYILGVITGIIFLVIEPYKRDPFVRFHAFQSIFYWVACVIVGFALVMILPFSMYPLILLVRLAMFAGWIFLMYKAYSNEKFKLPLIGDLAEKQAASA
jgi:uncharacterized membrane protein